MSSVGACAVFYALGKPGFKIENPRLPNTLLLFRCRRTFSGRSLTSTSSDANSLACSLGVSGVVVGSSPLGGKGKAGRSRFGFPHQLDIHFPAVGFSDGVADSGALDELLERLLDNIDSVL